LGYLANTLVCDEIRKTMQINALMTIRLPRLICDEMTAMPMQGYTPHSDWSPAFFKL
jgi:hypothetical protein